MSPNTAISSLITTSLDNIPHKLLKLRLLRDMLHHPASPPCQRVDESRELHEEALVPLRVGGVCVCGCGESY